MANKFSVLGHVLSIKDSNFELRVRRNFKEYSNEYAYDTLEINYSVGISKLLLSKLEQGDLILVCGRLKRSHKKELMLLAEHITLTKELSSS